MIGKVIAKAWKNADLKNGSLYGGSALALCTS
jgi:hypothetical protein